MSPLKIKKRAGLDVELLDLRDYPLPFFEEPMPPGMARDAYTNPVVVRWRDKVREADGFIICTPEYNHGYPAVPKNALDYVYFPNPWFIKDISELETEPSQQSATALLDQLTWWAGALHSARTAGK